MSFDLFLFKNFNFLAGDDVSLTTKKTTPQKKQKNPNQGHFFIFVFCFIYTLLTNIDSPITITNASGVNGTNSRIISTYL